MAIRWKNCPYCGANLYFGSGNRYMTFGNPLKKCPSCHKIYKDSDIIDWNSTSIFKKISYCFANGRFALCFFTYLLTLLIGALFGGAGTTQLLRYAPIAPLITFALCVLYVISEARIHYYQGKPNRWDRIAMIILIIGHCVRVFFLVLAYAFLGIVVLYAILHLLNII